MFCLDGATSFAILDGASIPNLPAALLAHGSEHACLLRGALDPDMAQVAPYLVVLGRSGSVTDWLLQSGWGKNWGILGISPHDLHALHRHFRRCVEIEHAGKPYYFRYYDPAVLRNYLPTCTCAELRSFFGPVQWFLLEDEEPENALLFNLREGALQQRAVRWQDNAPALWADMAQPHGPEPSAALAERLTLRTEQLEQLGRSIYVERMRGYLYATFPETAKQSRKALGKLIEDLTERAAGYKLVLETHVAPFIAAALILGLNFDEDYPVAQEVLLDYEMDCERKAQWLWDFVEVTAARREEKR
ncbi:DUF4123 domain-containing protein [Geomonas azotofigens]|uniref:DUF4123 domain-containing protein n=1 Tax=Geomonas azotofigens TaxID=2843196 RepID=UPI001C108DD5|nr:DUF4123 domain-containing protein [Geomonas azotofigens]MBU5613344.1 DUF4123 domain-containing protein [Geomonas azotofigens]